MFRAFLLTKYRRILQNSLAFHKIALQRTYRARSFCLTFLNQKIASALLYFCPQLFNRSSLNYKPLQVFTGRDEDFCFVIKNDINAYLEGDSNSGSYPPSKVSNSIHLALLRVTFV